VQELVIPPTLGLHVTAPFSFDRHWLRLMFVDFVDPSTRVQVAARKTDDPVAAIWRSVHEPEKPERRFFGRAIEKVKSRGRKARVFIVIEIKRKKYRIRASVKEARGVG